MLGGEKPRPRDFLYAQLASGVVGYRQQTACVVPCPVRVSSAQDRNGTPPQFPLRADS